MSRSTPLSRSASGSGGGAAANSLLPLAKDSSFNERHQRAARGTHSPPAPTDPSFNEVSFVDTPYSKLAGVGGMQSNSAVFDVDDEEEAAIRDKDLRCRCCRGGFHMSRRRYYGLVCGICSVICTVLFLIFVYVIVPALIHEQLGQSTLDFSLIQVEGVPGNNSIMLRSQGSVGHVLKLSAKLDEVMIHLFQLQSDVSANATAVELGYLLFPAMTFDGATDFDVLAPFTILSPDAFDAWMKDVILEDTVGWQVKTTVSITPLLFGTIPLPKYSNLPYDKVIQAPGCGGLSSLQLLGFDMHNSTKQSLYVTSMIQLTNPSVFGIDPIGALHFDIFYLGYKQGTMRSISSNVDLVVGLNTMAFSGLIEPNYDYLNVTNDLVVRYLRGIDSIMTARPASGDGSSIPLYNGALSGLDMAATLPGLSNTSFVLDTGVISANMVPSLVDQTIDFDLNVYFTLNSPLGQNATLIADSLQLSTTVFFVKPSDDGGANVAIPIGTLAMTESVPVYPYNPDPFHYNPLQFRAQLHATLQLIPPYTNYQEFVTYFVGAQGMVQMNFSGYANVTATYLYGKLDINELPMEISVTLQGGQGLPDSYEKSLSILGNRGNCSSLAEDIEEGDFNGCGVVLSLSAAIFNPSLLSLNMSNSWFDLYREGVRLGSIEVLPLYMKPGLNDNLVANGYLNPAQEDLPIMSAFMSAYVRGENHTMELRGRPAPTVSTRGDSTPSAHDLTMSSLIVGAKCVGKSITLLNDFSIKQFIIDFSTALPPSPNATRAAEDPTPQTDFQLLTAAVVTAHVQLPPDLNLPLNILSTDVTFAVSPGQFAAAGYLNSSRFPVTYEPNSNTSLILAFDDAEFIVTNNSIFETFAYQAITNTEVSLTMDGLANPDVETNMGILSLSGIHQTATVSVIGYNSFVDPKTNKSLLHINSLDLLGASRGVIAPGTDPNIYTGGGTIELACNVTLMNPSQVAIRGVGLFKMDVWYGGLRLVTVQLTNFTVELGENVYAETCRGTFWNPLVINGNTTDQMIARTFLSNYLNFITAEVGVFGKILQPDGTYLPGTEVELLQPAFNAFQTHLDLPGNPTPFIQKLIVTITIQEAIIILKNALLNKTYGGVVQAQAELFNPFSTPITVTNLNVSVLAGNLQAPVGGWLVQELGFPAIYIEPHSRLLSPQLPVYLKLDIPVLTCLFAILFNPSKSTGVSLVGELHVWIGSPTPGPPDPTKIFNQTLDCAENLIPTTLANISATAPTASRGAVPSDHPFAKLSEPELWDMFIEHTQRVLWPAELGVSLADPSPICPFPSLLSADDQKALRALEKLQAEMDAELKAEAQRATTAAAPIIPRVDQPRVVDTEEADEDELSKQSLVDLDVELVDLETAADAESEDNDDK